MSSREVDLLRDRSLRMLRQAKSSLGSGDYDLAAFMAEQAIQLNIKSEILEMIGEIPRTHALRQLFNALKASLDGSHKIDEFVTSNRSLLIRLEDAYINSRYVPRDYEKVEAEELVDFAEEAIRFVESIKGEKRD